MATLRQNDTVNKHGYEKNKLTTIFPQTGILLQASYHEPHHSIYEPRCEKPALCICKNKDADQLRGNCEADQRLCFCYIASTIPLLPKFKPLAIFCGCTARFVWEQVRNPEDQFSRNEAHLEQQVFYY